MLLHFIDVIEFDGSHIRSFYGELAKRLDDRAAEFTAGLRDGVSPTSAVLAATRLFLNYFQLEILFGVPEPFGKDTPHIVREIADMFRHGIEREETP